MSATLSLTQIINIDDLQKLQDAFAKANMIASTIVKPDGEPITRPSNHSPVCTLIRQTAKGLENCILSGKKLGLKSLEQNRPYYRKCYSVGFIDACAPIVIEGVHVANWLIGQNCVGDVNECRIVAYSEEIGADKDQMRRAFQKMQKISEGEFKDKLEFLWLMANQISHLAFYNLKNRQIVADLEKAKMELEAHKNNLEQLVAERTAELKTMRGLVPICGHCKKIRDDKGYWNMLEAYIEKHSDAKFSHSICQECAKKYYPDFDIYDDQSDSPG